VSTTMIYTHVAGIGATGTVSPLDAVGGSPLRVRSRGLPRPQGD
jgi:hypothetical protein